MNVNRREFLYAVAGGTASIAGWVLIPGCASRSPSHRHTDNQFRPQMASQFAFRKTPSGGTIIGPDPQGLKHVVCEVNECGFTLLQNLNGINTLQDVARNIHAGHAPEHLGHTVASVAAFLAMLAQVGVLSEPFFVNLESSEVTA